MSRHQKKQLSLIRAFVASPGDLNAERDRFRRVIEEVNRIKAETLSIHIMPLGWEDTLPGKGRPQELINQDIESCDIFVLLLWKRWGSPSGEYSSGTEEEFELARRLNEDQNGKPYILLYFKTIPDDMLADPGPQLRQTLSFRSRIEQERSFFYSSFDSEEEWENKFRDHLCRWLDKQPALDIPPARIEFPPGIERRIRGLEEGLKSISASNEASQSRLAYVAAALGIKAMDAAREGRFTEAQSLFASSLATYEHRETINAYVVFMEDLGRSDLIDEKFKDRRRTEDPLEIAATFAALGSYHARRGDVERAASYYARAYELTAGQKPIEFYSCFISYSAVDQPFAERLYSDLQAHGVRCWFAPVDLKIGDKFTQRIDESIRIYDKLVIILSENSVDSEWVEQEIETAFENERREGRVVLFPLRLDDAVMRVHQGWPALIRRTRHIGDFTDWKNHDSYRKAFERLLRDLKADENKAHSR
jgi:tetratricopeptide (TPR) repeat protein